MNLYEFEGKKLFEKYGIATPRGVVVRQGQTVDHDFDGTNVVVKAQILSGKRGKNNGIRFCTNAEEMKSIIEEMFQMKVRGQHVAAVRIEEKLDIADEHYLSITYDTNKKVPVLIYSREGGVDIEDVPEEKIIKIPLDIETENVFAACCEAADGTVDDGEGFDMKSIPFVQELWDCFRKEDTRLVEINPLVKTVSGEWVSADAKVAIDDDAFFRHEEWQELEPRTEMGRPPTAREIEVKKIDSGEGYYRGTAGKYIEMDGDIALILNGGGASITNMDALINVGLQPANYTEYSGNPPREKVYELTKIILSKPGIKGLWACGVVSNFTNVEETFKGFADALDEIKPTYPIVVRRDGPGGEAGRQLLKECAERNGLNMKVFGKDVPMTETASVLADMIAQQ